MSSKIIFVLDKDLEERLRAFLHDPSRGYIPRGALSNFVVEAVREKLDKSAKVSFDDLFDTVESGDGRENTN